MYYPLIWLTDDNSLKEYSFFEKDGHCSFLPCQRYYWKSAAYKCNILSVFSVIDETFVELAS